MFIILSDVGDDIDQHLKKAYESVLILSLLNPAVNNTVFQEEIKSRALHDYGFEFQKNELVSTLFFVFALFVIYILLSICQTKVCICYRAKHTLLNLSKN